MPQQQSSTCLRDRLKTREPEKFNVIMLNDDYTTMDFVVKVLMTVFFKTRTEAEQLMLKVHHAGRAVVGTYPYDIALSKIEKVKAMAKAEHFPLELELQPAE